MISQSFIKDMLDYHSGECGIYIESKHKKEFEFLATESMKLGIYFEYCVTGGLPRSGVIPEPVKTKTGIAAAYKYAEEQADRVRVYLKRMGIRIIEVAPYYENGYIDGHIDAICESKELGKFVLDLKYSGLLDDRWSDRGWIFTEAQRRYHSIQACHYTILTGLPFYYLVTESKSGGRVEMFKMEISDDAMSYHVDLVSAAKEFEELMEVGLEPRPEVTKCESCPLYEQCNHRAIYPTIKTIIL